MKNYSEPTKRYFYTTNTIIFENSINKPVDTTKITKSNTA